jgi:hypothetical protein
MVHTKNGLDGPVQSTPDVVHFDRNTPRLLREIVSLLLRHQARFEDDCLRSLYIQLHQHQPPQIKFTSELMP